MKSKVSKKYLIQKKDNQISLNLILRLLPMTVNIKKRIPAELLKKFLVLEEFILIKVSNLVLSITTLPK